MGRGWLLQQLEDMILILNLQYFLQTQPSRQQLLMLTLVEHTHHWNSPLATLTPAVSLLKTQNSELEKPINSCYLQIYLLVVRVSDVGIERTAQQWLPTSLIFCCGQHSYFPFLHTKRTKRQNLPQKCQMTDWCISRAGSIQRMMGHGTARYLLGVLLWTVTSAKQGESSLHHQAASTLDYTHMVETSNYVSVMK